MQTKDLKGSANFPPIRTVGMCPSAMALFLQLRSPSSTPYLAENVDNITTFKCQLIRYISCAVPQTLIEIGIIGIFAICKEKGI